MWDNVQIVVQRKHQGLDKTSNFKMWAMTFAVQHRLPSLQWTDDDAVKEAMAIPASAFLPSYVDWEARRQRCIILVARILVNNIPFLTALKKHVPQHFPHERSKEMAQKTEVINLGVVEANPSSLAIDITQHLHRYVPDVPGDKLHVLPSNGDQLTVERSMGAIHSRVRSTTARGKLAGLLPTPQEFHKEGILLQV